MRAHCTTGRPTTPPAFSRTSSNSQYRKYPGARDASITVVDSGHIDTPASTGPYAFALDRIQEIHRDGPCVTAAVEDHVVSIDDIASDERWPGYRNAALEQTPIRSVMSFRMFTLAQTLGALNIYSEEPHAFDTEARELGVIYATHAALAWDSARRDDQFTVRWHPAT